MISYTEFKMIAKWFVSSERNGNGSSNGAVASYQTGDKVRSGRFGNGIVRAFNSDGTVIVRFEEQKKSQRIFPYLLEKYTQP